MQQTFIVLRHTREYEELSAVHDCAAKFDCPQWALDSIQRVLDGKPVTEEDRVLTAYAAIEYTPALREVLNAQDWTYSEALEAICKLHSPGDAYIGRDQLGRALVLCDRPVTFCFADDMEWQGLTDDTYWNGFLNVSVDSETFSKIRHYFLVDCGYDPEEVRIDEVQPDANGRYSLAYGFATSEA